MSLLIVNAVSEDVLAAPANRKPNYIVVSVTDAAGMPVTGLAQPNFQVRAIISPGRAPLNIEKASGAGLPGCYILSVVPTMTDVATYTWQAGTYVFGVAVARNTDKGQTLASVLMN